MNRALRTFGWSTMMLLASLIVLVALRYLTLDPDVFFPEQKQVYKIGSIHFNHI